MFATLIFTFPLGVAVDGLGTNGEALCDLVDAADEVAIEVGLAEPPASPSLGGVEPEVAGEVPPVEPVAEAPPAEAPVPAPPTPWAAHGLDDPTPQGYYYQNGRPAIRIIDGNPKNSVSVRCFKHTGCSFLLPLRIRPSDEALFAWWAEVPALPVDAPAGDREAAAMRHNGLAARFKAAGRAAAP